MSRDEPAEWLAANLDVIPAGAVILDVASGTGRNALFLASSGYRVHAVDRDADVLDTLVARATARAQISAFGSVTTERIDLENGSVSLGFRRYDVVVVFNYLHRALMPAIVDAVAEPGVLIYETFTLDQARRGRPRNPAFLLRPGELVALVAPLHVVRKREGEFAGKCIASVVAMR